MRRDQHDDAVVRLVPLVRGDARLYRAMYTDAQVMRHVGAPLSAAAADMAFEIVCQQIAAHPPRAWYWRIHRASAGEGAAAVGLAAVVADAGADRGHAGGAELGVLLAASTHGEGLATAAIVRVAAVVFAHTAVQRLWTRHAADHDAAAGLMRTLAFRPEGQDDSECRWSLERASWAQVPDIGSRGGSTAARLAPRPERA